ncbi:MAG: glutaminase A [Legionellaceae bacterium]|nr:glutaminase A [Legionellaceae bacterium]
MRHTFFALILILSCSSSAFSGSLVPEQATLNKVYHQYKSLGTGSPADYIPELAKVNPDLFSISVVTVDGKVMSVGDKNVYFSLQSISKVFTYALALNDHGEDTIFNHIGLEATGDGFNSIQSIENKQRHNAFVNIGAIQTTSYIKGKDAEDKWSRLVSFSQSLGNKEIFLSDSIYRSESSSNQRNRAISHLLESYQMIKDDPKEVLDRYTKACSLMLNTETLALMGATLANHGVNPKTHQRVLSRQYVRDVLSQMVINGIYEKSGTWFVKIGIPAKSGVSGAILAIIPNKMAIAVYSPNINEAGTSVRGEAVIEALAKKWDLHMLSKKL